MGEPVIDAFELLNLLKDSEEINKISSSEDSELLIGQGPKLSSDVESTTPK